MSPVKRFGRAVSGNLGIVLPLVILVLLIPILIGVAITLSRVADQQMEIKQGNIATCERTNEARVASIVEKHQSVKTLRKTLHLWNAAIAAAPPGEFHANPLAPLLISYVNSLQEELDTKREGIRKSIEAQADVAVKPGSPVVDCKFANP